MNRYIIYSLLFLFIISSCKKEASINIIADNDAPGYDRYEDSITYGGIPTILLENYVNRIYIDLLGREPFDAEMQRDVQYLRSNYIGMPCDERVHFHAHIGQLTQLYRPVVFQILFAWS